MADYGNYCPVSLATEVLADRWTPMILRELVIGSTRFNDIARGLPGISRSLLIQRLRHLERKGVLERWPSPAGRGSEYRLTPAGKDLEPVLMALGRWAIEWLYDDLDYESIDAITLTWWMHRRIDTGALPDRRVVLQLDHTEPEPVSIWLVLDRGEASVCVQPPGFDVDLLVRASTPTLAQLFNGLDSWRHAIGNGSVAMSGPPSLCRQVPRWFLGSPFVPDVERRARQVSSRSSRSA